MIALTLCIQGFSLIIKSDFPYLLNRTQKLKINENFRDKIDIKFGLPQGFVSGLLLFNIDVIDLITNAKILMLQVMLMTQHRIYVQQTYLV